MKHIRLLRERSRSDVASRSDDSRRAREECEPKRRSEV